MAWVDYAEGFNEGAHTLAPQRNVQMDIADIAFPVSGALHRLCRRYRAINPVSWIASPPLAMRESSQASAPSNAPIVTPAATARYHAARHAMRRQATGSLELNGEPQRT
ncbi:MAG: hypothetical protein ACSLE6_19180, partial [Mycobacterium sp.]